MHWTSTTSISSTYTSKQRDSGVQIRSIDKSVESYVIIYIWWKGKKRDKRHRERNRGMRERE